MSRRSEHLCRQGVRSAQGTGGLHKELAKKLAELERKIGAHDESIQMLVAAIRQLMLPPEKPKRKIGYISEGRAVYRMTKKR